MKTTPIILALLAGFLAVGTPDVTAQGHRKPQVVQRHQEHPGPRFQKKMIRQLPRGYTKAAFGGKMFFHRDGIFYRPTPGGYVAITGPVGYRVNRIPALAVKVRIGPVEFYYHYGTYYRYVPEERVYVVVNPERDFGRDTLTLIDGRMYYGQFLRGDSRSVDFRTGGEILEIGVQDILSLTFARRDYETLRG